MAVAIMMAIKMDMLMDIEAGRVLMAMEGIARYRTPTVAIKVCMRPATKMGINSDFKMDTELGILMLIPKLLRNMLANRYVNYRYKCSKN